ncbi:MAG TPA: alkaline phosphatase family protein, partial [Chondromyces sp.]|nr:alkaline phosphatase family protein [Chondromyces sp.]
KQQTAGFWFKVKKANKDLSSVKMYRTAVTSGMIDGPNNFEHEIKDKFGFFPDQDDLAGLQNGWITRKEYEEISSRFVQWITDVSLYIKERYQPDLLMFYTPQIDHEEHYYLLTDPRQPGYSKEKSERYMSHIRWAYQLADQTLGQTLKAMDKNDRLMVVSDHGMEPVHSMLSPNYELKEAGLLKLNDKGQIDVSQSKAYAVASGSVAHVYINLKGREKGGIVEEEEYEEVQNEIVEIFKDVKDERKLISRTKLAKHHFKTWRQSIEEDGLSWNSTKELFVSLYETVTDKDENPYGTVIKMDTKQAKNSERANAGDIILSASKGYIMGKNAKTPIEPAVELGSHGGNPARKELHPVFYAYGKGINPAIIERKITVLDIAPTVYEIMDLKAPSFVDGHPIKEIVKEETN